MERVQFPWWSSIIYILTKCPGHRASVTQQTYFRTRSVYSTAKVQQYLHTTETRDAHDLAPRALSTAGKKNKKKSSHPHITQKQNVKLFKSNRKGMCVLAMSILCWPDKTSKAYIARAALGVWWKLS